METITCDRSLRLSPWFVTGFVEGDGCFTFSRTGSDVALYFALKRPARDLVLLERIRVYFGGIGRIYVVRSRQGQGTGVGEGARYFRVSRREGLACIVKHLDRYPLQGAKREVYRIWREMARIKRTHFRSPPRERLENLAEELSAASRGSVPR